MKELQKQIGFKHSYTQPSESTTHNNSFINFNSTGKNTPLLQSKQLKTQPVFLKRNSLRSTTNEFYQPNNKLACAPLSIFQSTKFKFSEKNEFLPHLNQTEQSQGLSQFYPQEFQSQLDSLDKIQLKQFMIKMFMNVRYNVRQSNKILNLKAKKRKEEKEFNRQMIFNPVIEMDFKTYLIQELQNIADISSHYDENHLSDYRTTPINTKKYWHQQFKMNPLHEEYMFYHKKMQQQDGFSKIKNPSGQGYSFRKIQLEYEKMWNQRLIEITNKLDPHELKSLYFVLQAGEAKSDITRQQLLDNAAAYLMEKKMDLELFQTKEIKEATKRMAATVEEMKKLRISKNKNKSQFISPKFSFSHSQDLTSSNDKKEDQQYTFNESAMKQLKNSPNQSQCYQNTQRSEIDPIEEEQEDEDAIRSQENIQIPPLQLEKTNQDYNKTAAYSSTSRFLSQDFTEKRPEFEIKKKLENGVKSSINLHLYEKNSRQSFLNEYQQQSENRAIFFEEKKKNASDRLEDFCIRKQSLPDEYELHSGLINTKQIDQIFQDIKSEKTRNRDDLLIHNNISNKINLNTDGDLASPQRESFILKSPGGSHMNSSSQFFRTPCETPKRNQQHRDREMILQQRKESFNNIKQMLQSESKVNDKYKNVQSKVLFSMQNSFQNSKSFKEQQENDRQSIEIILNSHQRMSQLNASDKRKLSTVLNLDNFLKSQKKTNYSDRMRDIILQSTLQQYDDILGEEQEQSQILKDDNLDNSPSNGKQNKIIIRKFSHQINGEEFNRSKKGSIQINKPYSQVNSDHELEDTNEDYDDEDEEDVDNTYINAAELEPIVTNKAITDIQKDSISLVQKLQFLSPNINKKLVKQLKIKEEKKGDYKDCKKEHSVQTCIKKCEKILSKWDKQQISTFNYSRKELNDRVKSIRNFRFRVKKIEK